MKTTLTIIIIIFLSSCSAQKQVNDTEHLWQGANGIEFYE
jgi:outer membrane biogenesis lipoprotein LolB